LDRDAAVKVKRVTSRQPGDLSEIVPSTVLKYAERVSGNVLISREIERERERKRGRSSLAKE